MEDAMSEEVRNGEQPPAKDGKRERLLENGFRFIEQDADFGRGKVKIIQVLPSSISEAEQPTARKQIFIPGYRPSWVNQPQELEQDLLALAEINQEIGRDVVQVGVAFTGDRKHSAELVPDLEPGIDVSVSQYEKAQDIVAAVADLVPDGNAEIVAHSLGGVIALCAKDLGLQADSIGLFNSAGMYKGSKEDVVLANLNERIKTPLHASFHKVKTLLERRKERRVEKLTGRAILNRILESRVDNYAAYRSIIHPYLVSMEGTEVVLGNSEKDRLYSRERVRNLLHDKGVLPSDNIRLVDLPWGGHSLGKQGGPQRKERLTAVAKAMQNVSRRESSESLPETEA